MKSKLLLVLFLLCIAPILSAQTYQVSSPDGAITIKVDIENGIKYSVLKKGKIIINPSSIGINTSEFSEKIFEEYSRSSQTQNIQVLRPQWGISARIPNNYVCMTIRTLHNVSIEFRAYNNGVAWRFVSDLSDDIIVYNEQVEFVIPEESTIYYPEARSYSTSFEPTYKPIKIEDINSKSFGLTPLMFKTNAGNVVVISESDLFEYPGMFIQKDKKNIIKGVFPKYPKRESQEILGRLRLVKWPHLSRMVVRSTEDYIAKTSGKRTFPWRVIMIADSDREILDNTLVYQLADYPQYDFSWVQPGKVVWDWYHNCNLQGVDFKSGINTHTYKYMIDFASSNGIEYINIDDGWSKLWNLKRVNSKLNLDEVISYAKERNVGVFLWAMWNTLDKDLIANLDRFQQMGIAGLKVDFFDRCDQRMVDFVNQLAEECAKRKLLLNLHGIYKPTGISRTFPNVLNIEGVLGLEYNKFSNRCTPEHNLTIPFIRNIVGPMDYTPGAMRYHFPSEFKKSWSNPHAMSTRAQQLAMYVVYHGGVQMLADSPTFYEHDEVTLEFLSKVPVIWDESIPIIGEMGKVIVMARRKGSVWYVAGMAGESNQLVSFSLYFLGDRQYQLTLLTNGETPDDILKDIMPVSKYNTFTHEIIGAGGFVMILE
jgi:alpha-glucosidase